MSGNHNITTYFGTVCPCLCGSRVSEASETISVVAISDSHSMHSALPSDWPAADIFVHTGDLTQYGTKQELQAVIEWLGTIPYKHKIVIAGNHDIGLDKSCNYRSALARRAGVYATCQETDELVASMRIHNITYLSPENPSVEISIKGCQVSFYGLPFSPLSIGPSAFMRPRSEDSWAELDSENRYDILLSHTPPRGYLDRNRRGDHVGCDYLLTAIERVKPQAVIFGHIHEARGSDTLTWADGTSTALYNAAIMNKDQTLSPLTSFNITLPKCNAGYCHWRYFNSNKHKTATTKSPSILNTNGQQNTKVSFFRFFNASLVSQAIRKLRGKVTREAFSPSSTT